MRKIDWSILKRSLDEKLSEDDKAELDSWLQESDERVQYYHKMVRFFYGEQKKDVDVDGNWQKFIGRHQKPSRTITRIFPVLLKYAAVFFLLISATLYWQLSRNVQENLSLHAKEADVNQPVGVVLHTGSGEKVFMVKDNMSEVLVADSLNVRKSIDYLDYKDVNDKNVYVSEVHKIEVPRGTEFSMTLSDGTYVMLNSETVMEYPVQYHGDVRSVSLKGEAYFEVAKNGKPFVVKVNGCTVNVLGTHFNIRAYEDENQIQTTLVEGSVEVKSHGDKVLLEPGEQAVLTKDDNLTKRRVDVDVYVAWKDGRLVFVDERLEDVLNTIARWYNLSVFYEKQSIKDIRINGILDRGRDASALLHKIEKAGVAKFKINGNTIVID